MKTLNVMLAEDHTIVSNGIKLLLESDQSIKVVGLVTSGTEVLKQLKGQLQIDVLLTDINMPDMDGITLIQEVRKINQDIRIIVLSMYNNINYVIEAFASGVSGYLLKDCSVEELRFAINNLGIGQQYLSMNLSGHLLAVCRKGQQASNAQLKMKDEFSDRELEVLGLISEGLTNKEMSERLFLSKRTIEGHRQSLLNKTRCKNTAVLIKFAVFNGLIK